MFCFFSSEQLPATTRERVISTFPHYGHGGIVESARELFMQLNECTGGLIFFFIPTTTAQIRRLGATHELH
jgi:hypothetical protein